MMEIEICKNKIMFEEKSKEIVKDMLKSVRKDDDPIAILLEEYIKQNLIKAYNLGYQDYYENKNHF